MTLNSQLPRVQGLRREGGNQLFYNQPHFLWAMTDSWGKGFEGTVSVHMKGTNLSGLYKNFHTSCEPGSEDSRVRLETFGKNMSGFSMSVPHFAAAGTRSPPQASFGPVQRVDKHLHRYADRGDTGLFTHFLESSILMLCLH